MASPDVLARGAHLQFVSRDGWEYVDRVRGSGVVAIIARTDDDALVLVEQHRPPVECSVIELPAGLAGDHAGLDDESMADAARRELLEETGFTATSMRALMTVATSAGLTNETLECFLAEGLERTGPGGGDETEDIRVHVVALDGLAAWLDAQRRERGVLVDAKVYLGAFLAKRDRS